MTLPVLKIDEKWSVEYHPDDNDRPGTLLRHGEPAVHQSTFWDNAVVAMFYALLQRDEQIKRLGDMVHERGNTIASLRHDLKKAHRS